MCLLITSVKLLLPDFLISLFRDLSPTLNHSFVWRNPAISRSAIPERHFIINVTSINPCSVMKLNLASFLLLILANVSFAQSKDSIAWQPSIQVNNVPTFEVKKDSTRGRNHGTYGSEYARMLQLKASLLSVLLLVVNVVLRSLIMS